MLGVINVVQLGSFGRKVTPPEEFKVNFIKDPKIEDIEKSRIDLLILYRGVSQEEFDFYSEKLDAYRLIISENVDLDEDELTYQLFENKVGDHLTNDEIRAFLKDDIRYYFNSVPGDRLTAKDILVSENFEGKVKWNGNDSLELKGDYGDDFKQILFWPSNIRIESNMIKDFWLEYECDDTVQISIYATKFPVGSIGDTDASWHYNQAQIDEGFKITNFAEDGNLFVSLSAKGHGKLIIKALHHRYSREDRGVIDLGGNRRILPNREEILYYFNPVNFKPPLNVYFSQYTSQEVFDNKSLLESFGHPYLIISDQRGSGGQYYVGSKKYEKEIIDIIRECLGILQFKKDQMIFSGFSMGAFGALYYGSKLLPHAVIVGKPLVNLGTVALNEKAIFDSELDSTLDLLNRFSKDEDAVEKLNNRFWEEFDKADWGKSKIAVAYMIDDEYDPDAYKMLQEHLDDQGAIIYGKGVTGRHNDDNGTVGNWFIGQYREILRNEFDK